jgi:hypothetical protein
MMTSAIMHNHISLALNDEDSNNQQYSKATKIHRMVFLMRLGVRSLECTATITLGQFPVILGTNEGGMRTSV